MAILMLAAVIGVIVWSSRNARRATFLTVEASRPNTTWRFDIRDMNAELRQTIPAATLGFYELRRLEAGRWDSAPRTPLGRRVRPRPPRRSSGRMRATTAWTDRSRRRDAPEALAGIVAPRELDGAHDLVRATRSDRSARVPSSIPSTSESAARRLARGHALAMSISSNVCVGGDRSRIALHSA